MGRRITIEHVLSEFSSMTARAFAIERLGVGDWPATDAEAGSVIKLADWNELEDPASEIHAPICLAWDVSPDRRCSIGAGGKNADDRFHVEIVEARQGTAWLVDRLVSLVDKHGPEVVAWDSRGPGASLTAEVLEALAEIGYTEENGYVRLVTAAENAQACGLLVDAVDEKTLRHLGDARLENALRGAATRPLQDSFSWARRSSGVDISPLFAVTLALWATAGCPDTTQELAIY
jgi:hypothetical protein